MEKVKFDPGFAPFVDDFIASFDIVNQIMASVPTFQQKKFKFRILHQDILKLVKNNVSFYLGCLLWAYFLVNNYNNSPREIDGNPFYNLNEDKIKTFDFFEQIDFIINYFSQYEKDTKYYMGKALSLNPNWLKILKIYKEFLFINNNFVEVKTTSELCLPDDLKNKVFDFDIEKIIKDSIDSKNIEKLIELNIIF